jgi:hypothetical protein
MAPGERLWSVQPLARIAVAFTLAADSEDAAWTFVCVCMCVCVCVCVCLSFRGGRVVPVALLCLVQLCVTTPHPEGVRDMTQRWAESQVGEVSRKAQAAAMARGQREPGTLLLTMIVKNEAARLDTSLPAWAPLIDSWVIGVDRNNTDNTEEIILKHLGNVPGEILIVDFDGMGPTWTKVVQHGLKKYPAVTHGILSDADFTPLASTLSKWDLDRSVSKHTFTVLEADGTGTRVMDWIYRHEHEFSKVLPVVAVHHQYSRALTFESLWQQHPGRESRAPYAPDSHRA